METNNKKPANVNRILILRIAIIATIFTLTIISILNTTNKKLFNQSRAFHDVEYQLSLGPRVIGSSAHEELIKWATTELNKVGWEVRLQTFNWAGEHITNIIATRNANTSEYPWIILGAHYDSRFFADRDSDMVGQKSPVPGANDGASGVAVLLEIARTLPSDLGKNIWIILFDAEDNGGIPGWEWIIGSSAFAANLVSSPDAVVIVDMVGDADLNIYMERNSNQQLLDQIWGTAEDLGYHQFIHEYKYQIHDDHIPFAQIGIPAVDIIDFDYPYWHTTQDTLDKISPDSLGAVGEVLLAWLKRY